jgi:hypothetical protein
VDREGQTLADVGERRVVRRIFAQGNAQEFPQRLTRP